jgi:hypothetical protein
LVWRVLKGSKAVERPLLARHPWAMPVRLRSGAVAMLEPEAAALS